MQKRILVMPTSFNVFGAETNMLTLIKAIHASPDYQLHVVISGWNNGQFEQELKRAGIQDYSVLKLGWVYVSKPLWTLDTLVHLPGAYRRFLKLYRQFQPDIVFTNSYRFLFWLYPFLQSRIILRVQDQLSADRQARRLLPLLDRKISRYYVVSDFIRRDLLQIGIHQEKISVIHNGIRLPHLTQRSGEVPDKKIMHIGIVGQVIPLKGHHVLIEALGKLGCMHDSILLEIWGSGDAQYMQQLKTRIRELQLEDRVVWKGYEHNKHTIYRDMDLLIAPTTYPNEAFGLVVIEALAYGIPVIASNAGGFPEVIEHGKDGFLFSTDNAEELAGYIQQLYQQPDLRRAMGIAGRKKAEHYFTKERMVNQFFELLNEG